jgi:RNA recognition motif-containing protein
MVRTKVFVGNLAFKTKEADLANEFAAFKVVSTNIITRRSRSLGYGFVELETLEDAQQAAQKMNKKVIDGREINVELAKVREERPPGDPAAPGAAAPGDQDARPKARRPLRPRQPQTGQAPAGQASGPGANAGAAQNAGPRRRFLKKGPTPRDPSAPQNGTGSPQQPRQPRQPRPKRIQEGLPPAEQRPRNPSKTTLFVANLPFSVDDAGLKDIFKDFAANLKSAHVVVKRNGRSKGFGFVELDSEEAQLKARDAIDKQKVDSRELIVKVALTEDLAAHKDEKAEPAPTTATTTTATSATK